MVDEFVQLTGTAVGSRPSSKMIDSLSRVKMFGRLTSSELDGTLPLNYSQHFFVVNTETT